MARTIWKYPLAVKEIQSLQIPAGARLLHVATQNNKPCLWAEVIAEHSCWTRLVVIYGTGHPMPDDPGQYLGSFQMHDGEYVFHAYEPASSPSMVQALAAADAGEGA